MLVECGPELGGEVSGLEGRFVLGVRSRLFAGHPSLKERDLLASFRRAEDDRAVALVGRRTGEEDDLREVSTDEVPAARHFVIGSRQSAMSQLASAIAGVSAGVR